MNTQSLLNQHVLVIPIHRPGLVVSERPDDLGRLIYTVILDTEYSASYPGDFYLARREELEVTDAA